MIIFNFLKRIKSCDFFKSLSTLRSRTFVRLLFIFTAGVLAGCTKTLPFPFQLTNTSWLVPQESLAVATLGFPSEGYVALQRPTSLSLRGNDIYIADSGLHRIYRYDRTQHTLTPFATNTPVDANTSLYVSSDGSVYVTNPNFNEVLHFNRDGTSLPSLISPGNLVRPVCVTVDESNGLVLVADGQFNQVIVFDHWGMVLSIINLQQVKSIGAMNIGPDGIYILDRLAKRVVVLRRDGSFLYALNTGTASAMTVNHDNLLFVGDSSRHSIQVYRNRNVLAKITASDIGPDSLNSIDALTTDGIWLYIADRLRSRVQIMQINPREVNIDNSVQGKFIKMGPNGNFR